MCHIDLYALFSGAGTGGFVQAVIDHQMLPGSECLLYPSAPEGYSVIYSDEHESLPVIMRLYHDTFRLAAQLGFLATRLRHDKQNVPFEEFDKRSQELSDLRQAFGRLWESPDVAFLHQHQDNLPRRSREFMQQVSSFRSHSLHLLGKKKVNLTLYSPLHYTTFVNSSPTAACGPDNVSSPSSPQTQR